MAARQPFDRTESWIIDISPLVAQRLLDVNSPNNRELNQMRVRELVVAIQSGQWNPELGSTITLEKGFLTNGQHRMCAIIQTRTTLPLWVYCDVDSTNLLD